MTDVSDHQSLQPKPPDDDLYEPAKPSRWKRRLVLLALLLLSALVAAEWMASSIISAKLRSTVSTKLDAELRLGPVIYIPPYGAIVFNPQLVRGSETLFSASRIRLKLGEFPQKDRPLLIASLRMNAPVLSARPRAMDRIAKPSAREMAPRKFSEMLRLSDVHLYDGKIEWHNRGGTEPMSWEGLSLDVETAQQSPSKYSFHLVSRAQLTADISATGDIDVDSLEMLLRSLSLRVRVEPEPTRTPLPAVVQQWLKNYGVNGNLAVTGTGKLSLRDMRQSSYSATIVLDDATAELRKARVALDRASANLTVAKKPGEPMIVRLQAIEAASGGKIVSVNKGQLIVDAEAGRWSLSDVDGRILMAKPAVDGPPASAPASKWEEFQPAGRADFSLVASGPFKVQGKAWQAIDHEIIVYPRGASFVPKDFAHPIEDISGGEIRIKGGMIVFQELNAKYGGDLIRLRSARLPLDGLPDLSRWQEISAAVIFHQPIRRYAPALDKIFDVLNPDGAFLIAGSYTRDKTGPASKTSYDLIISTDRGAFDLTSHHIPLDKIRGDATVSPAGVQLHGLEAELLGGRVTLTGQWNRNSETAGNFDGDLTMSAVNLGRLADVSDNPPDVKIKGKLFGQGTFSGTTTADRPHLDWTKALRASGEMEIIEGDFFKLPVFKDIFERIRGLRQAATVGDGAAIFDVAEQHVILRDVAVNAPILGLQGSGKLGFDGAIDAGVVAAPLADWRDKLRETKIPIISDVAGEIAGAVQKLLNTATGTLLYQFHVTGNVHDHVDITTVPAPILTETAATVFGRMLTPRKDQRPLDWFRRDNPRATSK